MTLALGLAFSDQVGDFSLSELISLWFLELDWPQNLHVYHLSESLVDFAGTYTVSMVKTKERHFFSSQGHLFHSYGRCPNFGMMIAYFLHCLFGRHKAVDQTSAKPDELNCLYSDLWDSRCFDPWASHVLVLHSNSYMTDFEMSLSLKLISVMYF